MNKQISSATKFLHLCLGAALLSWTVGCIGLVEAPAGSEEGAGDDAFDSGADPDDPADDSGNASDDPADDPGDDPDDAPSDDPDDDSGADPDDDGSDPGNGDPPAPTEDDAAQVLGWDLPAAAECGEQLSGTVTMINRGLTTWSQANGYKLGAVDDSDPFHGGDPRVWLPESAEVAPGQVWTFDIDLEMPTEAGTWTTDWQMVHEHVRWFGEQVSEEIDVTCGTSPATGPGGWVDVACARNGSEICDDELFYVIPGVELGIRCQGPEGGIGYIASNTGPTQADGNNRCQGWEDQGLNAWDYLNYVGSMVCDQQGAVLPVDVSAFVGDDLWFGSHDNPGGGGHMTNICLVQRVN